MLAGVKGALEPPGRLREKNEVLVIHPSKESRARLGTSRRWRKLEEGSFTAPRGRTSGAPKKPPARTHSVIRGHHDLIMTYAHSFAPHHDNGHAPAHRARPRRHARAVPRRGADARDALCAPAAVRAQGPLDRAIVASAQLTGWATGAPARRGRGRAEREPVLRGHRDDDPRVGRRAHHDGPQVRRALLPRAYSSSDKTRSFLHAGGELCRFQRWGKRG
jgi:hypothetical protein